MRTPTVPLASATYHRTEALALWSLVDYYRTIQKPIPPTATVYRAVTAYVCKWVVEIKPDCFLRV